MADKPFEWESNPDLGDPKPDFRDELISMNDDEIIAKYTFYQFLDLQVGIVLYKTEDNFEAGFPDGRIRRYEKDIKNYAIPTHAEKKEFILRSRNHRLEELLNGSD